MRKLGLGLLALAVVLFVAPTSRAADAKQIKADREFRGSVEDAEFAKMAPKDGVIATRKGLEKLWKAWNIKDEMPDVDFTKQLVLVGTTVGSRLNVSAMLKDDGDLQVLAIATRDLRPGFRYQILVIKSEGVKTVGGKPLPKE
jgi:hypothetical protein